MQNIPYRSAIGALMYLTVATRPDIACSTATSARYMTNPGQEHWTSVKRAFRYLQGNLTLGLVFDCSTNCDILECFSDSDWAADQDGRRSTTGYVVYLYGCAISWKSKLQKTVAHSSTEAEYYAMSDTAREVMWLRGLMKELGIEENSNSTATPVHTTIKKERDVKKDVTEQNYKQYIPATGEPTELCSIQPTELSNAAPTVMLADNQGAIQLAKNPVNHERTKHIDIKHHYIRERVQDNAIDPVYVHTKLNDSDIFTKTTCTTEEFILCRDRVMGYDQSARVARHEDREAERAATPRQIIKRAKMNKSQATAKKKAAKATKDAKGAL